MTNSRFILKPGKEDSFRRFHPWVFSGAIQRIIGEPTEGDVVTVEDWQGNFVGVGHYQIGSIAVYSTRLHYSYQSLHRSIPK